MSKVIEFVGNKDGEFVGTDKDKIYNKGTSTKYHYLYQKIETDSKLSSNSLKIKSFTKNTLYYEDSIKLVFSTSNNKFILKLYLFNSFIKTYTYDFHSSFKFIGNYESVMKTLGYTNGEVPYPFLVSDSPNSAVFYDYDKKKFFFYRA